MRRTLLRLASLKGPNVKAQTQSLPVNLSKPVAWDDTTVEVEPSQHVLSVCKQHRISFPSALRPLGGIFKLVGNPFNLNVSLSQQHCFLHQSIRFFDKIEHPFSRSLLDIYIEKKKEPLWVSGFAYGASAFPNKTASAIITHALRDALAAAGYDRFGRRVSADDDESSVIADLYGTLRVVSNNPQAVCNAKFADVLESAKAIIFNAEVKLRRDKNGCHLDKQQLRKPLSKREKNHYHLDKQQPRNPLPKRGAWQNPRS
ncbi:hypothetical protein F5Y12DRAFT_751502 [Xylaria sp. FL1777]|nr:hypothetical protein F5Y12DRAFT_751502 [Xylaria sp. FL1777]